MSFTKCLQGLSRKHVALGAEKSVCESVLAIVFSYKIKYYEDSLEWSVLNEGS
jgi:hypothetical protein